MMMVMIRLSRHTLHDESDPTAAYTQTKGSCCRASGGDDRDV